MKRVGFFGILILILATACNTTSVQNIVNPTRVLGTVELSLNSAGVSSARFANRSSTLRESDVVFGSGITQVITTTNDPFNYLVATFPVSHASSSTTLAFNNLTLYAEAKAGNVGDTAIKTITNFGGVTNPTEQARLAKLVAPVHAVTTSLGNIVLDNAKADFQAFTNAEVTTATSLAIAGGAMTASDSLLNYGFSARCDASIPLNCTTNSRVIAHGKTGFVTLALRVPKSSSAYKFVLFLVVMDESIPRVTRSLIPVESVATTETRGLDVSAVELMQFGLNRSTTSLSSKTVDDVNTSKLGASIFALGLGRISAGNNHSCGLDATGKAYCWGDNAIGKLGNGSTTASNIPVAVSDPAAGAVKFSSIGVGDLHSCALSLTGEVYCWGTSFQGRNGSLLDSSIPVLIGNPSTGAVTYSSLSVGSAHSCALRSNGSVYCWGNNDNGELGVDSTITASSDIPVLVSDPIAGAVTYSSVSAGNTHTCAVVLSNAAYCWGNNDNGQLGISTATAASDIPVLVTGGLSFSSINAGNLFSCSIDLTKDAYCWGNNSNGQLGNNNAPTDSSAPVLVNGGLSFSSISLGDFHTCAISVAGSAYCWGSNNVGGQLGNGGVGVISGVPVTVSDPTGGAVSYSSLSAGANYSCAVTSLGNLYCWGSNGSGQFGDNTTSNSSIPTRDGINSFTL
jgi:alpha-tubulin suppressor-like RCC1 family protein